MPRGCFTNILQALQHNLAKIYYARNHIYDENFKLKVGAWDQIMASDKRTNFQLEILTKTSISAIHNFRENVLWAREMLVKNSPGSLRHQDISSHGTDYVE